MSSNFDFEFANENMKKTLSKVGYFSKFSSLPCRPYLSKTISKIHLSVYIVVLGIYNFVHIITVMYGRIKILLLLAALQMFTGNYGGPAGKICNIYGKGL